MVAVEAWFRAFQAPTLRGWIVVVVAAAFPTLPAQMTFLRAVKIIGPGQPGIFINLLPGFAAVFAAVVTVFYLGEQSHFFRQ